MGFLNVVEIVGRKLCSGSRLIIIEVGKEEVNSIVGKGGVGNRLKQ